MESIRRLVEFFRAGDTRQIVRDNPDLFCLLLSKLVYQPKSCIAATLTDLGVETALVVEYSGPAALCLTYDDVDYVAVKGLSRRNPNEWSIIFDCRPQAFGGVMAHGGFARIASRLFPHVLAFRAGSNRPAVLTGHSMGGAVATLTGLLVEGSRIVTFGSPRMVRSGVEAFEGRSVRHYRVDTDIITYVPFRYQTPGECIVCCKGLTFRTLLANHSLLTYANLIVSALNLK
jgi:hypothetical protein